MYTCMLFCGTHRDRLYMLTCLIFDRYVLHSRILHHFMSNQFDKTNSISSYPLKLFLLLSLLIVLLLQTMYLEVEEVLMVDLEQSNHIVLGKILCFQKYQVSSI